MYTLYTCTDCTVVTVQKKTTFVYSSVLSIPTLTINDTVHLYCIVHKFTSQHGDKRCCQYSHGLGTEKTDPIVFVYIFSFFINILEFKYDFNSCMKMRISVSWCILLSIGTADVLGHWFDVFIITHLKVRVKLKSWNVAN